MIKTCAYCDGEMDKSATVCEHCGRNFESIEEPRRETSFYYYIDALKQFANFKGRASRRHYWMFILSNFIIVFTFLISTLFILSLIIESVFAYVLMIILYLIMIIYSGFIIVPSLAISVRRLHDQNRSGWFLLFNFIPIIGNLVIILLMVLPGTPYANQYGPYNE